jgi:hypothetical protein
VSTSPLPIPQEGLDEVLSAWSGRGQLLDALASVADDEGNRAWSAADVRRRAHRVLLAALVPLLEHWPQGASTWLDALPAESVRATHVAPAPAAGVSWPATRRLGSWPPGAFIIRTRHRVADTLLVSVMRWTLEVLAQVRRDATAVEPSVDAQVRRQLDVALALLDAEPILSASPLVPDRHDLTSVRREGRPWSAVAGVCELLVDLDTSLPLWAARMVAPDPDLRWRLFHLGVFGLLLRRLTDRGALCISLRPLSASAPAPAYEVLGQSGDRWHLWFEAGGLWSYYDRESPYLAATAGLAAVTQPLEPDVILIAPGRGAFIIECKYSSGASTVGRVGVPQAMAYLVESRTALAPVVHGYVVSPTGTAAARTTVETHPGRIGVMTPEAVGEALDDFLGHVAPATASDHITD